MTEDTKQGIVLAAAIVSVVLAITVPTMLYHSQRDAKIADAIAAGQPPLEVMCAFENAYSETCRDLISTKERMK